MPSAVSKFEMEEPSGSVADRSLTIAASAGLDSTAVATLIRSSAVDRVRASKPLGSVIVVPAIPSARAVAFSVARNAGTEPLVHTASVIAMLLPDGSSSASRSWRSVNRSPSETNADEPPDATAAR